MSDACVLPHTQRVKTVGLLSLLRFYKVKIVLLETGPK